jgi:hypothetical protein
VKRPAVAALTCALAACVPQVAAAMEQADPNELTVGLLESALVRRGARLLPPGRMEFEPEVSYFYDEPIETVRRDHAGLAATLRIGLPGAMQADIRAPLVLRDRLSGLGRSSGLGDVTVALTRQLMLERSSAASPFAALEWRAPTGDVNSFPATGFGQHAVRAGVTLLRRHDPVVLHGHLSYVVNLGEARLHDGMRMDSGNVLGGQLGFFLVATPDTSLFANIALNSSSADRFDGHRLEFTDRLSGLVEIGAATALGRGRFLNVAAGIGFTPAAPKIVLTLSMPFYR